MRRGIQQCSGRCAQTLGQSPTHTRVFTLAVVCTLQSGKDNVVMAFYTLLVHVEVGKPTKLTWEYGDCSGCSDDECLYGNSCGVKLEAESDCDKLCKPMVRLCLVTCPDCG